MSSGINILFQFPTQCVQTQIWHELKKKKKRKKKTWSHKKTSQKLFLTLLRTSCSSRSMGLPWNRFKTQESHWLALQPQCLVYPLMLTSHSSSAPLPQKGKKQLLPVLLTLESNEKTGEMQYVYRGKAPILLGFLHPKISIQLQCHPCCMGHPVLP